MNLKALISPWWRVLLWPMRWYERCLIADIKAMGWDWRVSFHSWADNKPVPNWFVQAWVPKRVKETHITFQANTLSDGLRQVHKQIKEKTLD